MYIVCTRILFTTNNTMQYAVFYVLCVQYTVNEHLNTEHDMKYTQSQLIHIHSFRSCCFKASSFALAETRS